MEEFSAPILHVSSRFVKRGLRSKAFYDKLKMPPERAAKVLSAKQVVMCPTRSLFVSPWSEAGIRERNFFEGNFPEPVGEGRDVE